MSTELDTAAYIARLSLHDPTNFSIQYSQTLHRLSLVGHWKLAPGSRVLEIGCGQGDATAVLAHAVGEQGKVVAVDPADLDYGSPYTVGEARDYISKGPLGERIEWIQHHPEDYFSSLGPPSAPCTVSEGNPVIFDATVLAHSLWYFSSPSLILSTFRGIKQHSKRLLLAEWSLAATDQSAQPHVLAAFAQGALECRKTNSLSNIRTMLAPKRLIELALVAGWKLESENFVQPGEGLLDGQWEVSACLSSTFERQVEEYVSNEKEKDVIFAMRDSCEASINRLHGGRKGVRTMDAWAATFA